VNVLYGQYGAEVLSTVLNALFTQSSPGMRGGAETADHFGGAMY
jgi:hypothetical protein